MKSKTLSLRRKRALVVAGVSLVILTIAGTIAYHQDSMFFANIFRAKDDVVEFSETFDSPDDWQPCQEIPKTAVATNKNDTPRYVRMKINEYWRTKDTQTSTDDHTTSDLALTWNDNGVEKHYAVINTQNDDSWELKSDGWYYYKTTLAKDESTLSLLKSVTFNCEVNTVGEIRYSVDGRAGESMPNEYAEANYHLYITFQMSDEEFAVEKQRLYTTIAGLSTNVDTGDNRVDGVNEYSASVSDEYPIYYYSGADQANNVIFADKCWLVVRTAERGSTKLLYNGLPNNGACDATGDNALVAGNVPFSINVPTDTGIYYQTYLTEQFSYMVPEFSNDHNYISPLDRSCSVTNATNCAAGYYFGNDVSWNEETGMYTLVNTYRVRQSLNNDWDGADRRKIMSGWRYTCHAVNVTSCSEVHYWHDSSNKTTFHMITFKNGKKLEDWQTEMFENTNDNNIKKVVDQWYAENILNGYGDKIEDVVYCNDRRIVDGPLFSKDASYGSHSIIHWANEFAAARRMYGNFTLDCADTRDSFTVSESNGNGDLSYPVAVLTSDEIKLTNGALSHESTPSVTMTPYAIENGRASMFCLDQSGNIWGTCSGVRPVLAVKYDTYINGGDGSTSNPYTLVWE